MFWGTAESWTTTRGIFEIDCPSATPARAQPLVPPTSQSW